MNVAFIPVRGGSKSIPLKNIKKINGKPLVYWTMRAASKCTYIDKVYVSTDSILIKNCVEEIKQDSGKDLEKIIVIDRNPETATDSASTEAAMYEFAEKYEFDNIVLIQATSPLLSENDLNNGFEIFGSKGTDSVLSVVKQKRFIWNENDLGYASPENYDYMNRPRRQEFEGYYVENGAFYITSRNRLLKTHNRISGNIRICEMDPSAYYELDEFSDWIIIENLLKNREKTQNISNLKIVLMDCDGVLTDGGMYYSENGDELKKFNTQDGMGIRLLREKGIKVGVITSEKRELNERRASKLCLDYLVQGVQDKISVVKDICDSEHIDLSEVLYIGDDLNDLEVIEQVGIGCSVANGRPEVRKASSYVSVARGGDGAVREIVDWILGEI